MATESFMVQLYVEQEYDSVVTDVPGLYEEAYLLVNPAQDTVVREIASEKLGGILGSNMVGAVTIGVPALAFTQVTLTPARGELETSLYAPSHVSSPAVSGVGLVTLSVREIGVTVEKGAKLILFRAIGAHVYVDQVDP